jgi:arylsulfatase A-like enzyme
MKHTLTLIAILLLPPLVALNADEVKPNVLLIISDDQGFGDFGFTGNKLVRTPNLDRLAGESAVYRNFVVAAACSPTRSALFTGRDHLLTGIWGVGDRAGLRDDETRMPAFFNAAGYHTLHVGKLDSAKVGKRNPTEFGWEDYVGGGAYEHRDPMMRKPKNSERGKGWTADLWTDYALHYIREHRDGPWFASVAYIIPHLPWVCDEKYSAPFKAQGCSENLAACYGSIAHMDECVGRLLNGLKETGQEQRTIVVFLSDNGPTSPETKTKNDEELAKDTDWMKRNVANLRGHKALVWENGDRVPLLVRWPGRIQPGERKQFSGVEDVLPTLLDLTAIKADTTPHQPFTGVSLRASVEDATANAEHPDLLRMAISGPGSPKPGIADIAQRKLEDHHLTLRGPRFKYHALPGGKAALYDIVADPGETTEVQTKFPEVTTRMAKQCRERWAAVINSGRAFTPEPESPGGKAPKNADQ